MSGALSRLHRFLAGHSFYPLALCTLLGLAVVLLLLRN